MSRRQRLFHKEYEPLHNSKKQYVNTTTGEVVSRSTFARRAIKVDTLPPSYIPIKHAPTGKTQSISTNTNVDIKGDLPSVVSSKDIQRIRTQSRYQKVLTSYTDRLNTQLKTTNSPEITKNFIRQNDHFKSLYKDYKNGNDRVKGGKRHQALIDFGILEEDDDYY